MQILIGILLGALGIALIMVGATNHPDKLLGVLIAGDKKTGKGKAQTAVAAPWKAQLGFGGLPKDTIIPPALTEAGNPNLHLA